MATGRDSIARPHGDWATVVPAAIALLAVLVLLGVPWPQNLFLIASGGAFVVAALNPGVGLGVLVASIPLQAVGQEQLGPIHMTVTKVIFMATVAAWGGRVLVERRSVRLDRVVVVHLLYVAVLAMTIVNAPDRGSWGAELYRWWTPLVVYLIAINVVTSRADARPILWGISIGTIATSIVGFVQLVGGYGPDSFDVNGFTRAYATFGQPNPFAGYLGVSVPLLIAVSAAAIIPGRDGSRMVPLGGALLAVTVVASGLGTMAMVLTQSRGGWLGLAAGLGCVAWLLGRTVRWSVVGLAVAVVALLVVTPAGQQFGSRFGSSLSLKSENVLVTPDNFAVQERLAHWRAGIAMAEKYPVLGVGAGNYSNRYREFTELWRFRISRGHAHNAYIHVAAQSGYLGLAAYLIFLSVVVLQLVRAYRASVGRSERPFVIGAIGVTVAFAVHNMFDYLHVLSLPMQLSAIWALAQLALPRLDGATDRPSVSPSAASTQWHRPGQMVAGHM